MKIAKAAVLNGLKEAVSVEPVEVRDPRLEGVDTPGKDERLDGLPDGYDDVEAEDDREIPPERPSQFREPADKAWRLMHPFGRAPEDHRQSGPALQFK